ncbi:MAG TPA: oxidoreductase [Fontimonas sp.]
MKNQWTTADMPSLRGQTALVTGANRGLGLEIALGLSGAGADVIVACRDAGKAQAAVAQLQAHAPQSRISALSVDMASPASIRALADAVGSQHAKLDLLIHNAAAIMAPLSYTAEGHELHLATNHLGPFALTGLLLDRLRAAPAARVVSTASLAHRLTAGLDLADPHFRQRPYKEMDAYGASKLAVLQYCFELDRRLRREHSTIRSVAAHPGYTATNLDLGNFFLRLSTRLFGQKPALGALPALYAASSPDVEGGDYIGPGGFKELGGYPKRVDSRSEAKDRNAAAALWALSEQLTGVRYLD